MNKTISKFLQEQTCASICCIDETGNPYCFSCFYAFEDAKGLLYFKSSANSHHAQLMKNNPFIAGTVLPDKLNKWFIKGIQFEANVLDKEQMRIKQDPGIYLKKHPLSHAIPGDIWVLQINKIKMTDSTMGVGKKIIWDRDKQPSDTALAATLNSAVVKQ